MVSSLLSSTIESTLLPAPGSAPSRIDLTVRAEPARDLHATTGARHEGGGFLSHGEGSGA
jgi:hypothetical protein